MDRDLRLVGIRDATRDDLPTLVGWWSRMAGGLEAEGAIDLQPGAIGFHLDSMARIIAGAPGLALVAEDHDRPVGALLAQEVAPREACLGRVLVAMGVYVDPAMRGRGVTDLLYGEMIARARTAGFDSIVGAYHPWNVRSKRAWERHGGKTFQVLSRIDLREIHA